MIVEVPQKLVPATAEQLRYFSRQDLRYFAKCVGIERGQNKEDTIRNLIASGKATICATLCS
jgi:hypothetical protein